MPLEIHLQKKPYGLIPLTATDEEELNALPDNVRVKALITKSKSPGMLRLYWAIVQEIAAGVGLDKVSLSNQLLYHTRRVEGIVVEANGRSVYALRRISKMGWSELRDYVSAAMAVLNEKYIDPQDMPGVIRVAERRAQISFDRAMRELEEKEKGKEAHDI